MGRPVPIFSLGCVCVVRACVRTCEIRDKTVGWRGSTVVHCIYLQLCVEVFSVDPEIPDLCLALSSDVAPSSTS